MAEGDLAAFTILPQPFRASSFPGATSIPRATADPGTISSYTTATTSATLSESAISSVSSWSDKGGISVYTDVRTTGTPRLATEFETVSNRAVTVRSGLRVYLGIWLGLSVLVQSVLC